MDVEIVEGAQEHGVSDDDMRHALANAFIIIDLDDHFTMQIGPDRALRLVEVGTSTRTGRFVIVHAYRSAHPKFLTRR